MRRVHAYWLAVKRFWFSTSLQSQLRVLWPCCAKFCATMLCGCEARTQVPELVEHHPLPVRLHLLGQVPGHLHGSSRHADQLRAVRRHGVAPLLAHVLGHDELDLVPCGASWGSQTAETPPPWSTSVNLQPNTEREPTGEVADPTAKIRVLEQGTELGVVEYRG